MSEIISDMPSKMRMETLPDPEQKIIDGQPFPAVFVPTQDVNWDATKWSNYVRDNQAHFKKLLSKYGAILFRGFCLETPEDFDMFSKAFGHPHFPYIGGAAVRKNITGNVYTANESPPESRIPFHHEIGQQPIFPMVLFFYCDVAPPAGGETSLVLSNVVYREMKKREPEFVAKIEKEKVIYRRILPNGDDPTSSIGRGWQSTFLTDDPKVAEERCLERNTQFEWLPDGCMDTFTNPLAAVREDERSGKKMWHNSISGAYRGWRDSRNSPDKAITFGNGDPMPAKAMDTLEDVLDSNCADFVWKKGDMVIVDNRMCLHGRRWFTPPRKILAVLCNW